jgi:hypothetical protein
VRHHPNRGPRAHASTPTGLVSWGFPASARNLLRPATHPGEQTLRFVGVLEITYTGAPEDPGWLSWHWNPDRLSRPASHQRSQVYLSRGRVTLDARGEPDDPFGVVKMGYLAFRRLAMLLPVEYGLPEE